MVSRSAPLWQRAAFRIRHGHRTLHRVDLWHRARARDDSVPEDALSAEAMTLMRGQMILVLTLIVNAGARPQLKNTEAIKNEGTALTFRASDKSKPAVATSTVDVPAKF